MMKFVNAKEMNKKYPKTFFIPTDEELDNLKEGDSVKICANDERFWVTVVKVNGDDITGTVDNNLIDVDLEYGEEIEFKKENVYTIW